MSARGSSPLSLSSQDANLTLCSIAMAVLLSASAFAIADPSHVRPYLALDGAEIEPDNTRMIEQPGRLRVEFTAPRAGLRSTVILSSGLAERRISIPRGAGLRCFTSFSMTRAEQHRD